MNVRAFACGRESERRRKGYDQLHMHWNGAAPRHVLVEARLLSGSEGQRRAPTEPHGRRDQVTGGILRGFTAYGTPTPEASGAAWVVGRGGAGLGGSAWATSRAPPLGGWQVGVADSFRDKKHQSQGGA